MTVVNSAKEINPLVQSSLKVDGALEIGNKLNNGTAGGSSCDLTMPEEEKKIIRDNEIRQLNLKQVEFETIINKAFHLTLNDLYGLSDNEFKNKIDLIRTSLNSINPKNTKTDKVNYVINKINLKKSCGLTDLQAINAIRTFKNADIFTVLKNSNSKLNKFKSPKDIKTPDDRKILQDAVSDFLGKNSNGTGDKDIGGADNLYFELLNSINDGDDELKIDLYSASKNLIGEQKQYDVLITTIRKFRNPVALNRLLSDENIEFFITNSGFSTEEVKNVIFEANKALDKNENLQVEFQNRLNLVTGTLLKAMQEAGKQHDATKFGNPEHITDNCSAVLSMNAIIGANDDIRKEAINIASNYGISEKMFEEVYKYAQEHPELDVAEILDKLTDGQYSEFVDNYRSKLSESLSDNAAEGTVSRGYGFEQKPMNPSYLSYVEEKLNNLYNNSEQDRQDNRFYVEKNITKPAKNKSVSASVISDWSVVTSEDLRKHNVKFSEVLDNYKNLSKLTQLFVNDMISHMTGSMQSYYLNGIKAQNHVVLMIVKKISADPDKLNLSLDYASEKELERMKEEKNINN